MANKRLNMNRIVLKLGINNKCLNMYIDIVHIRIDCIGKEDNL